MTKTMTNRFTCDANGCNTEPVYTAKATPDGWTSFEYRETRLWACRVHADLLERYFGKRQEEDCA